MKNPAREIEREQILTAYKKAYKTVNGKEPIIIQSGGWWRVGYQGSTAYRIKDFLVMTEELKKSLNK